MTKLKDFNTIPGQASLKRIVKAKLQLVIEFEEIIDI